MDIVPIVGAGAGVKPLARAAEGRTMRAMDRMNFFMLRA